MACTCPKNYHLSGEWCVADAASYMKTRATCTNAPTTSRVKPPSGGIMQTCETNPFAPGCGMTTTKSGRPAKPGSQTKMTVSERVNPEGITPATPIRKSDSISNITKNLTDGIQNIFNKPDNTLMLVGIGGFLVITIVLVLARR